MVLKRFGSNTTIEDSYELPWLEEYVKSSGDKEAVEVVYFVTFSDSGAMVYTRKYKAHIKARRGLCAELQEALEAYAQAKKPLPQLFCGADRSKRPIVLQDDEKLSHRWNYVEGRYVQVLSEEKRVPSKKSERNPLLDCLEEADSDAETFSAHRAGASSGEPKGRAGKTK